MRESPVPEAGDEVEEQGWDDAENDAGHNEEVNEQKTSRAHWEVLAAADFTTIEVWTCGGLVRFYILVVMRLSTRRVEIAGVTPHPGGAWVQQAGRNLTDCYDGSLGDSKYLLLDRDKKFLPLRHVLESTDTKVVLLPPKSPNLIAHRHSESRPNSGLEAALDNFAQKDLRADRVS